MRFRLGGGGRSSSLGLAVRSSAMVGGAESRWWRFGRGPAHRGPGREGRRRADRVVSVLCPTRSDADRVPTTVDVQLYAAGEPRCRVVAPRSAITGWMPTVAGAVSGTCRGRSSVRRTACLAGVRGGRRHRPLPRSCPTGPAWVTSPCMPSSNPRAKDAIADPMAGYLVEAPIIVAWRGGHPALAGPSCTASARCGEASRRAGPWARNGTMRGGRRAPCGTTDRTPVEGRRSVISNAFTC